MLSALQSSELVAYDMKMLSVVEQQGNMKLDTAAPLNTSASLSWPLHLPFPPAEATTTTTRTVSTEPPAEIETSSLSKGDARRLQRARKHRKREERPKDQRGLDIVIKRTSLLFIESVQNCITRDV